MRKLNIALLISLLVAGLIYIAGCTGDEGPVGPKGAKGRRGGTGIDTELGQPIARHFGIGVTNSSRYAVNADLEVYITFDSTVRASRDTVVANYVTQPPLIDGIDGEEPEWGLQKSRIRLAQINSTYPDNQIYEVVTRFAWDENYIYSFFQWKEKEVKVPGNADSVLYAAGPSDQPGELILDIQSKVIDKIIDDDTIYFQWLRREILDISEVCDTFIIIPGLPPVIVCHIDTLFGSDTTYVWQQKRIEEDKLVLVWNDQEFDGWSELALQEYFGIPNGADIPAGSFVDAWVWGSATSNPVAVFDDWSVQAIGLQPDAGDPPFLSNFVIPDSTPRYQLFRDPNYRSASSLDVKLYPFWYFDAVTYARAGWDVFKAVFAAGIVSTIPSDSRADIYAVGIYDATGTVWTVEMRRARRTYSGDDVKF